MAQKGTDIIYPKEYFEALDKMATGMPARLAKILVDLYNPKSVIDLGCAAGLYLKPFLDRGVHVLGMDNSNAAREISAVPSHITIADLRKPLHIEEKFDLAICMEVVEHIEGEFEDQVFDNICNPADIVIFSGATLGQTGFGHINLRPKQYWLDKLRARGFVVDYKETAEIVKRVRQGYHLGWLGRNILALHRAVPGGSFWDVAQEDERAWWGTCQNTFGEETKQLVYAEKMGLESAMTDETLYSFDMKGASILDIGGGPSSLLLKCRNTSRAKVTDPLTFPAWVEERYESVGIEYEKIKGEDIEEKGWDEIWIYNVLTHAEKPQRIIEKARKAGKVIRIFEWVDIPTNPSHPHSLKAELLDQWLGSEGTVEVLPEKGRPGVPGSTAYYGVFPTSDVENETMVHFILTSDTLIYPYYLAIVSALKTQKADKFILWTLEEPKGEYWPLLRNKVELRVITDKFHIAGIPDEQSYLWRVSAKDWFQTKILYTYGGLFLDLDTFCLTDVTYLLDQTDKELVLCNSAPEDGPGYPFFNVAVVMAQRYSPVLRQILFEIEKRFALTTDIERGEIGRIFSDLMRANVAKVEIIKVNVLDGGGTDRVEYRLYEESGELWEDAKVLHLYGTDMQLFQEFTEEYMRSSNILFARIVRETLTPDEWGPNIQRSLPIEIKHQKRFHLLGVPHLPTNKVEGLACAYSQKVLKMAQMLKSMGHTVFFYGVEGSTVECDEFIQVSTKNILQQAYGGYDWRAETFKHDINDIAYRTFFENTIREINKRKVETDFLLFAWNGCKPIYDALAAKERDDHDKLFLSVETGIGYDGSFAQFRVFESYTFMNHVYGKTGQDNIGNYDVVIPNFFDDQDFEYCEDKEDYFLYLGRIILRKGLLFAKDTVEAIGAKLLIAGQDGKERLQGPDGKPDGPLLIDVLCSSPNIEFVGFADHKKRKKLLSKAKALFVPTWYIPPFEGVSIEAAFSGTPVITTDLGAFAENVIHGKTGYRCRTLDHFVWAAQNIDKIKPADCYQWAMDNFSLERVREMYEEYWNMLLDIKCANGWSRIHPERTDLDWLSRVYPK
jgi:glycosyltransferase involved in cell wall biosynthesis/2-polyprenyl-3-methyl-5-hydroxy-6-metoxy-1,4-benzoquinol methylase